MTKLQVGDRVWVDVRDGTCTPGWYELKRCDYPECADTSHYCFEHSEGMRVMVGTIRSQMVYRNRVASDSLCSENYHNMAEQLIADGSWPE